MEKVRCINKVGYNDIKLKRFVDYNEVIEVDEERAKYLVEARGLCERIEENTEGNDENNPDDENNLDDKTNENTDNNKSNRKGKK